MNQSDNSPTMQNAIPAANDAVRGNDPKAKMKTSANKHTILRRTVKIVAVGFEFWVLSWVFFSLICGVLFNFARFSQSLSATQKEYTVQNMMLLACVVVTFDIISSCIDDLLGKTDTTKNEEAQS